MLKQHAPLALILALHLALAATFAALNPLGEAPDEPAHFRYAQFIAGHGRPPATLAERAAAGYRAAWPPLYHLLAAAPVVAVGSAPPTRLKAVGDSPRRLLPTNGQTIAAFIHTDDEAWPWRGVTLAWHLARLVSVALSTLAVGVTYFIAFKVTRQRGLAAAAAAIHAALPQFLFIGSAVSDDSLLVLLSSLVLLVVVDYTQQIDFPRFGRWLLLGGLLGLATVTKYNALPLWGMVLLWSVWLARRREAGVLRSLAASLVPLLLGAALTAGWWFIFVWANFNRVTELGWLAGSLAALAAGTADASLRQLSAGAPLTLPPPTNWLSWAGTLFQTFWGSFGGGSTINFLLWHYGLLAGVCGLALFGLWRTRRRLPTAARLLLAVPLFFLPLPLLRFALSGSLIETAQGRHLFPALPAIVLGLAWGLAHIDDSRPPRLINRLALPLILLALSLAGLSRIEASFPPPIPLRTTANAYPVAQPLNAELAAGVRLAGYEFGPAADGVLPLTLVWQAEAVPAEDVVIDITVTDTAGQEVGGWLGQPLGGRYPGRAWDEGDTLRDVIPLALLPAAGELTVSLRLLDGAGQPAAEPLLLAAGPITGADSLLLPSQLRADGLPPDAPFTYRGTLSFRLPGQTEPPLLVGPAGQTFAPASFIPGGLAHFIVAPNWPNGDYQINSKFKMPGTAGQALQNSKFKIDNRPRQFEPPPLQYPLNANFAGLLTLLGYDLPQRRVAPGQSFPITLHWQANHTTGESLAVFNHLLDAAAVQRGGADRIPQNYYTTLLWVPGEIVSDSYEVPVDAGAPPGVYWLDVGLYPTNRPASSLPLQVDGQPIARNSVSIGPLKMGGPPAGVTVPTAAPQTPLDALFGGQIALLGFDAAAGKLTLYWQATTDPPADYTVFVHFVDEQGQLVAQADGPPAGGAYPTSLWAAGEIIPDTRSLPELPPGRTSVVVGLYRPDSGERLPVAGSPDGALRLLELSNP